MADELHSPLARRLSTQLPPVPDSAPRLKRLSLVAARDSSSPFTPGSPVTPRDDEGRGSIDSLRTPVAASPSPSPRPRHSRRQSSISYSPSISSVRGHAAQSSLSLRKEWERATPSPLALEEEKENERWRADALTLGEKHSDLLRMIAMRERRVNELKQELAIQEEALASLRARWTAIARADAVIPTSTPTPRRRDPASHTSTPSTSLPPLVRTHPNSVSTSSTASSLPTVPDEEPPGDASLGSPNTGVALGGLWNAITADADETIQEGKRFWGQLLRTVGAAAGGNIPEEGAASRQMERTRSGGSATGAEGKLEIPNLRSMVSSMGFLPTPVKPHTPPPLERRSSRSSTKSAASATSTSRERSPAKSPMSNGSHSPTRSVRSLRRVASSEGKACEKASEKTDTATSIPLLSPTPIAPERRLSVRLKRAALSPRPRPLTGEVKKEDGKEEGHRDDGEEKNDRKEAHDSPRLVTATLESVGW
ncbi:hypothetical protein CC85DRAFT_329195 [Cutaneotrichosporon oleaginosum]|uniref:DUF4048 domain-containing protein n=1 Tax=Cutaneotrichosporon oleaginosum TaxID=879819 RepID=A0A0J0XJP8_9TREE|nr:uncharacterized protein CC85DRAFT_329195 [Cutaneotrichosporon oleaginosum]KLT41322.1 hypothetical protein CC85DRAFT_329195 [Cutaneotrichosporon oleaginosum]TXT14072.1 hypothetical protein COLE_00265 [Cutaneotrichosporon oleaginosum]